MKTPVVAIGLHAASPVLLEKWMSQGHLKNLSRLRAQGAYGRLDYTKSSHETQRWRTFLTGCLPTKTGYWGRLKFREANYHIEEAKSYDFANFPPFYALGEDYRVAVVETPTAPLSERVKGLQVLGKQSSPPQLIEELNNRYGKPQHYKEYGCWWAVAKNLAHLQKLVKTGITRHSAICHDLLQQEEWDLFLTVIEEAHYVGHDFWYLSQAEHPLYEYKQIDSSVGDPLLDVYEDIDRAVGEILAKVPENARVVVFSIDGMGHNRTDLPSTLFLGEFLYRWNFPGKQAIAPGKLGTTPPPPLTNPKRQSWAGEVWQLKHDPNPVKRWLRQWVPGKYQGKLEQFLASGQADLASPYKLLPQFPTLSWQPAMWYSPLWPQMKAFALPSFSNGHIRINLQGRESAGVVSPADYDALCDELTQQLHQLKDGRTGASMVKQVIRTRQSATDATDNLSDADLVVVWQDQPTDVLDSPEFGRIGPVPYCNTGGHWSIGFLMAKGAGITPGSSLPDGHVIDLAPTILELMGAPLPDYFEGQPLIKTADSQLLV